MPSSPPRPCLSRARLCRLQVPIPGPAAPLATGASSGDPAAPQCLWLRLSAAAYNDMEDFVVLRDVVLALAAAPPGTP